MRCKGCGYSLWNVPGRTCPECGRPFEPGEFEFLPNAVEFCCPGCMQQYYGTDGSGLPVPREFACVRCSRPCSLATMVVRAAPGFRGDDVELRRIPWEVEGKGAVRRFAATVRDGLGRPGVVGLAVRHRCDGWKAFRFVLLLGTVVAIPTAVTILAVVAFSSLSVASSTRSGGATFRSEFLEQSAVAVLLVACWTVAGTALLVLWAWCVRLLARVLGSPVAWRTAWCSLAYGSAPLVLVAVPCIGPYCGSVASVVWVAVAAAIILAAAGPIPGWKAALAVGAPPLLLGCVLAAVPVAFALLAPAWSMPAPAPLPAAAPAPDGDPPADPGAQDAP